ncbi:hypothetical protein [Staphylococcus sp. 17KM0847]|uniref:hypothetical protein n=1 Tax=Staphylococcus sp. 17KM0847 TaxID=2583989 RepID=UPI0015DDA363|nr:hypothetical protein [Staphylococcus sp. 17KM0847]
MKLTESEKFEGIGEVTEQQINAIKTEEHEKDEFIGLKADEEVKVYELQYR